MSLAAQEYEDPGNVKQAFAEMQGAQIDGQRIVVERAGERRGGGGGGDRGGRGGERGDRPERRGPQSDDKCFNCGERGHW